MLASAPSRMLPGSPRRVVPVAFILLCVITLLYTRSGNGSSRLPWDGANAYLSSSKQASLGPGPKLRPVDKWTPPIKQYDPARFDESNPMWFTFNRVDEQFEPGTKSLKGDPRQSWPYPSQEQEQEPETITGQKKVPAIVPCQGPRGKVLDGTSNEDQIQERAGRPAGFAEPLLGSSKLIGFNQDVCFDRHGRYGAYGLKDSSSSQKAVNWDKVDWGDLQEQCINANKARFDFTSKSSLTPGTKKLNTQGEVVSGSYVPRTAILFRLHSQALYNADVVRNMRAVIQELALHTGGEYQAFALVEVKDPGIMLDTDELMQKAINELVPPEFRNMTMLWNQWRWLADYPLLPQGELRVHMSQWLPIQWFQRQHPDFDFFWNWEMDVRYTGNNYEWMRNVDTWTAAQPKRGIWERNARFYIPRLHGSWERYRDIVQNRFILRGNNNDTSIWGPQLETFAGTTAEQKSWLQQLQDIYPPVDNPIADNFTWGVGEKADFITFLPQFSPAPTNYVFEDAFWHYPRAYEPHDQDDPEERHDPSIPRRVSIITFTRVSARLLRLMELENTVEPAHHMSSEMWPETVALHYGLKSVSVPHGIYMENDWPAQAADWTFNSGDQKEILNGLYQEHLDRRGEGSGGPESPFGLAREHSWLGSTWYYQNGLAERLYRRWLGQDTENAGGPVWEQENGLYCLPPMMLHPIKNIEAVEDS